MSVEAVKAFVEKVKADPDLRDELLVIQSEDKDAVLAEVVRVASEAGFGFDAEDYEEAAQEMAQARHAVGELSDEDLDAAAGGSLSVIDTLSISVVAEAANCGAPASSHLPPQVVAETACESAS